MNILIAPNAFKHSLSAMEVAECIKRGLLSSELECHCELFPIADGGEGLTEIIVTQLKGKLEIVHSTDPLGRKIKTHFGIISGDTAVIELAAASGLKWLSKGELDPLNATSFGSGELIIQALDMGIRKFVIGLGNSATVDAAAGLLQALGLGLKDKAGLQLKRGGIHLRELADIDLSLLDKRIADSSFTIACDVDNPLLGDNGAAKIFAPQKGADPQMVNALEDALTHFNTVTKQVTGIEMALLKHGGAAGGSAAALSVFLNAKLVSGIEFLLNLTRFEEKLQKADLLITAEGKIDLQTIEGKGPYGVARLAKSKNVPVIALAGQIPADLDMKIFNCFDALFPISNGPQTLEEAISNTAVNLERTALQIAAVLNR